MCYHSIDGMALRSPVDMERAGPRHIYLDTSSLRIGVGSLLKAATGQQLMTQPGGRLERPTGRHLEYDGCLLRGLQPFEVDCCRHSGRSIEIRWCIRLVVSRFCTMGSVKIKAV